MKTSELTGLALDWAVATALGYTRSTIQGIDWGKRWKKPAPFGFWDEVDGDTSKDGTFHPSTNWTQGGPIIEREDIALLPHGDGTYEAEVLLNPVRCTGSHPLIAAMRCFVASELGEEVEVPEELT